MTRDMSEPDGSAGGCAPSPDVAAELEDELTEAFLGFASVRYPPDVDYHPNVRDQARMAARRFVTKLRAGT